MLVQEGNSDANAVLNYAVSSRKINEALLATTSVEQLLASDLNDIDEFLAYDALYERCAVRR